MSSEFGFQGQWNLCPHPGSCSFEHTVHARFLVEGVGCGSPTAWRRGPYPPRLQPPLRTSPGPVGLLWPCVQSAVLGT